MCLILIGKKLCPIEYWLMLFDSLLTQEEEDGFVDGKIFLLALYFRICIVLMIPGPVALLVRAARPGNHQDLWESQLPRSIACLPSLLMAINCILCFCVFLNKPKKTFSSHRHLGSRDLCFRLSVPGQPFGSPAPSQSFQSQGSGKLKYPVTPFSQWVMSAARRTGLFSHIPLPVETSVMGTLFRISGYRKDWAK